MSQDFTLDSFTNWLKKRRDALDAENLLRLRREVVPLPGGRCQIADQTLWNFAANDYLGLAHDPRLVEAAISAMRDSGVGARASALVTGRTPWHAQLEERLAKFKRMEAAILFPTGYAANVGTISALAGPGDVVFSDRLNHASLIDGCRLSRARFRLYTHRDVDALRCELEKAAAVARRVIVTDSLFSMDGDAAPLKEIVSLAEEFNAIVIVDEAHATGVFGERGTGLVEELTANSGHVITVGTFSKAVGVQGGFVTGSRLLIDWLWNSSRTQMFSTALAIPLCAAAMAAIDVIETEPHRRTWLREASTRVQQRLRERGWDVPEGVCGPIIPIFVGTAQATMDLSEKLKERGLLIPGIRPPTVPKKTSRLRISLSYAHGEEGINALLAAFDNL